MTANTAVASNDRLYQSIQHLLTSLLEILSNDANPFTTICRRCRRVTNPIAFRPFRERPRGLRSHHSFRGVESEDQLNYQRGLLVIRELENNRCLHTSLKSGNLVFPIFLPRSSPLLQLPTHGSLFQMDELAHGFEKVRVRFEWISTPFFKNTTYGTVYKW